MKRGRLSRYESSLTKQSGIPDFVARDSCNYMYLTGDATGEPFPRERVVSYWISAYSTVMTTHSGERCAPDLAGQRRPLFC